MQYASDKFTAKQIESVAKTCDARRFYKWLEANDIDYVVHDMCITDPNDGWFNISIVLSEGWSFDVIYADGVLEEATANEYSEI